MDKKAKLDIIRYGFENHKFVLIVIIQHSIV